MKKLIRSIMLVVFITFCIVFGRGLYTEAASATEVKDWSEFKEAINNRTSIKLTGDIKAEECILLTKNTTIDLNGHTYDATKEGDAFIIKSCKLTINDSSKGSGVFKVNSNAPGTSGITVGYFAIEEEGMPEYTGELTINGGTFIGNQGHQYNSIICVRNGSQCNVNGGVFKDSYCAFEMHYLAGECFLSFSGNVLITNNKVGIDALNLTTRRSPVALSDKAQVNITQNDENVRYPYGVQMPGYEYLFDVKGDISKCSIGMSVGKAYNNLKITNNYLKYNSNTPASKVFFIDNNTDQVIIQNSGEVYVGLADNASATVTTWNELSEAISTADDYASKRIKLGSNITAEDGDGPITITKDQTITIDFNGHYLDRGLYDSAPVNNGSVFENKGTLALINSEAGTMSYITGANTTGGCGAIKNAGGVLNVNNVGFLYNKAGLSGGAIQNSDGIVTINSSHIRGNTAVSAGNGIYNDGILRIKGVIDGSLPDVGGPCDTICMVSDDPIEVMGSLNDSRIDITLYYPDREVESYLITNGYGLYNTGSASEIFDVSDEKVSDYFKLGLNDDREVILQNKDVKDIRIHYIANNGSEEVISDLDVTDEDGHCYYKLMENPFDAPEGKYFVGWKIGNNIYPEKEYIHIDEDIDAIAQWKDKPVLTIKTTSISGVGKDGIEDYKITNIDLGTKLGDLLYGVEVPGGGMDYTQVKPAIAAHFAKTGYLLKTFIPNPISEYETWDDLPNTTTTGDFMSSKINDDLTVYAIMAKEMDSFKISIAEPACGQSVQDTTPEIDTMDGSHYSLSDDGYGATWNSTANVFHYGDEYSADIRLIPEIGYVFTTNPTGDVENGEVDGTPSYDDLNDKLFFSLTVHASQTKHINLTKYDRVAPTCTEDGEEERWLCPGCGKYFTDENATTEMTEQDLVIEKLGHDWTDTEYTWNEDNTEVTATRNCQRDNCTETETETVEATSEVTKEATETEDGEIVYTSKEFDNEAFEVQIKKEVIPAKGKTDPEEDDPGKYDPSGKTDPGKDDPSGKTDPGKTDSNKKANTLTVKGKTVKLSVKKLKKKNLVVKKAKAMKITKAQGKVSYKLAGVNKKKFKKYFKVNSKTGKITVKKKLKKGIYKVKIKVTAAGNDKYKKVTKTVTVKVRVK